MRVTSFFTATVPTLNAADTQNAKPQEKPTLPIEPPTQIEPQAPSTPPAKEVPPYFNDEEAPEIKHVEETHFGELLVKMLVMLACVLTFLYLAAWFAKKFLHTRIQGLNRTSRIQILESRAISAKSTIFIIKVDEHEFVISEFPNGIQLLKEITRS